MPTELFRNDTHACIAFHDLVRGDDGVQANQFLVIDHEQSALIDPGGALLYTQGWAQIMADALGRAVTASGEDEASARGAALVALKGLGAIAELGEHPAAIGKQYKPHPERHEVYVRARERQREMYAALKALG